MYFVNCVVVTRYPLEGKGWYIKTERNDNAEDNLENLPPVTWSPAIEDFRELAFDSLLLKLLVW